MRVAKTEEQKLIQELHNVLNRSNLSQTAKIGALIVIKEELCRRYEW